MIFKRKQKLPPVEPIPSVQEIISRIDITRYPLITPNQIEEIISWVIDETKISRGFGLYFVTLTLYKEIIYFLDFINTFGGIAKIKYLLKTNDQHFYTRFGIALGEDEFKQFAEESNYFFKRLSETHETNAPNAFDCHLTLCRATILRNITNYDIDPIPPKD